MEAGGEKNGGGQTRDLRRPLEKGVKRKENELRKLRDVNACSPQMHFKIHLNFKVKNIPRRTPQCLKGTSNTFQNQVKLM